MTDLPKTFDPAAIEAKWYAHWEQQGLFRPERPDATPFTIVNPPPNVTGSLHIGHALDNTLQDIVIRYERLRGKDALWVVGTDHAGIATQMVVERQMALVQDKRTNYTREQFIDKVWEWKAESGGTITGQLRRLGCSMDWSREQFTMDPHFTRAVVKVFVDLYNEGLLYRDKRLVNWDPGLRTAISDLEVETREVQGKFWHFRYPLADGVKLPDGRDHIVVATTRPETMLADMAVAVNGEDARYQAVIGKFVELPITGRRIPIVADEHADPELGSGAVKITPGHDFNDFEVGKRAGIAPADMLNMLDADAKVIQTADGLIPADLLGLSVKDAREAVVARIDALGLLEQVEDRVIQTPYGDRSGVVIEPWLTDQWYVDAATLAQPAIEAVKSGAIEIVPKTWEKTYFNWMENIQPWCVSRQLWWGHRIPVWYGPSIGQDEASRADGTHAWIEELPDLTDPRIRTRRIEPEVFVAKTFEDALVSARERYEQVGIDFSLADGFSLQEVDGIDEARAAFDNGILGLWQDPDVLDTWFSSALWPFATLGWPDAIVSPPFQGGDQGVGCERSEPPAEATHPQPLPGREGSLLQRHYPNDLLISGFDILFFWDARMAMQGLHFMKDVPWRRLYLHGLVRAADGQKMSKSKGNVVDPLGLIDQYGADALRFFMAAMESQGRDVKMDERRVEGYRNFATKLWNATRFAMSNGIGASASVKAPPATLAVNKWIIGEVVETVAALDKAMAELRFDAAANAIYHFVWDQFCDWYLELIKPVLSPSVRAEPVEASSLDLDPRRQPKNGMLSSSKSADVDETRAVAGWVIDQILVMLHPFMPFITEELWHALGARDYDIIVAKWPKPDATVDAEATAETEWLIKLISEVRAARAECSVPPAKILSLSMSIEALGNKQSYYLERSQIAVERLARVSFDRAVWFSLDYATREQPPFVKAVEQVSESIRRGSLNIVVEGFEAFAPLEGVIDIAAEKARLAKALEAATKEAKSLEGRLNNPAFVEKAKPEAVEKARADHAERAAEAERLAAALKRLG
jgi:valyl-tRNA synthetase